LRFPLAFQLDLAQVILEAFDLESELVIFSLKNSPMVSLLLNILGVLDQKLVLVNLELISLLPEVERLLLRLTQPSLEVINISPQLPLLLSVLTSVLNTHLQLVVISHDIINLFGMASPQITDDLVVF